LDGNYRTFEQKLSWARKANYLLKFTILSLKNYYFYAPDSNPLQHIVVSFCTGDVDVGSGVATPKIWWEGKKILGNKMFDFRLATVVCLGYRHSKHKMTRYAKTWGAWPHEPFPWLRLWMSAQSGFRQYSLKMSSSPTLS